MKLLPCLLAGCLGRSGNRHIAFGRKSIRIFLDRDEGRGRLPGGRVQEEMLEEAKKPTAETMAKDAEEAAPEIFRKMGRLTSSRKATDGRHWTDGKQGPFRPPATSVLLKPPRPAGKQWTEAAAQFPRTVERQPCPPGLPQGPIREKKARPTDRSSIK